jgi:hypothetical protein
MKRNPTHSEVLSGATFRPAANERAARAAARMHTVNGHRVKVERKGGKWGYWVWPKKRNPESAAVAMREAFTGLPSDKTVVVTDKIHVHEHLAALGELMELKVKTVKGETFEILLNQERNPKHKAKEIVKRVGSKTKGWVDRRAKAIAGIGKRMADTWINPRKANPNGPVLLCSTEDGKNLAAVGGDQTLDLKALGLGELAGKEQVVVGEIKNLGYYTSKDFGDGKETFLYVHKLSEESGGPRPMLRYATRDKKIYIDGGVFHIPKPVFGVSPGITD